LRPDNPKEAMYALGINLAHDASACLIGGNGASFAVREGMPLARLAVERTGCRRLCVVGHVHDVVSAVAQVRGELDAELFVHAPARSAALGAAIHGWHCALGQPRPRPAALRSSEARAC
jgi:predicted NodU family carbamoyl transferase